MGYHFKWPIRSGGGLRSRRGWCDSRTGFHFPGIGVERHTPVFQTGVEGALPSCPSIFAARNPGDNQDFTGLVAAVQLRLRVAFGLQALQRCSGLLNRRARGSTVATHHFRIRGEIIIILRFERRVCRWESCRMHQSTGMWFNPNSRGSRLRIWQPWGCKSRVADRRVVRRE
jgi:hypothetical protein